MVTVSVLQGLVFLFMASSLSAVSNSYCTALQTSTVRSVKVAATRNVSIPSTAEVIPVLRTQIAVEQLL